MFPYEWGNFRDKLKITKNTKFILILKFPRFQYGRKREKSSFSQFACDLNARGTRKTQSKFWSNWSIIHLSHFDFACATLSLGALSLHNYKWGQILHLMHNWPLDPSNIHNYFPSLFVKAGDIKTRSSVCHKKLLTWLISSEVFGMHDPCDKPFILIPCDDLDLDGQIFSWTGDHNSSNLLVTFNFDFVHARDSKTKSDFVLMELWVLTWIISYCMHYLMKIIAGRGRKTAMWATNVGNEHNQILSTVMTGGEGESLKAMIGGLIRRYHKAPEEPKPKILYVDRDCCGGSSIKRYFQAWPEMHIRYLYTCLHLIFIFMPPAWIVCWEHKGTVPSLHLFVCNSIPLTSKVQYLKFEWWYVNQTWTRITHTSLTWHAPMSG